MPSLLYQATIPVFEQTLAALDAFVDKASAYAAAHKIEPAVLLSARLRPDMLPFVNQTQIVCDGANRLFSPTEAEIDAARAIIEAFDLPENAGKGVIQVGGRMVERLHATMARRTLSIAQGVAARSAGI